MSASKPNIVFIIADQLRPDFLGCYGANFIDTPHIDRLAQQGIRYERAYSASPVCVPARASLLTGMNAVKNGVTGNSHWLRPDLNAMGIKTWPQILDREGYFTAGIGKMHFYPWDSGLGFHFRVAAEDKRWIHIRDDYYHFLADNGYRKLHGNEHPGYHENKGAIVSLIPWEYSIDHFVGQQACRFIDRYSEEDPFALMVSFPGPHCPYDPVPEFLAEIDPQAMPAAIPGTDDAARLREECIKGNLGEWNGVDYTHFSDDQIRKVRAHYAALVKQIDYEVGQILDTLSRRGFLDNTMIIFTSDHGDYLGDHGMIGKGHFYETSSRIPLIVRTPGQSNARVWDGLVELSDVTATMLMAAGSPIPSYMDAIPLPLIGPEPTKQRDTVIGMTTGGWMIHDGRWKLSKYATGEVHLFDLENDPLEQKNLAQDPNHAPTFMALDVALMRVIMDSIAASHADKIVDPNNTLWSNPSYGFEDRPRPYPRRVV